MNYEDKLLELAFNNRKISVLTAENRASIRKLPDLLKEQFIDTGINEQTLVGISAGLALRGKVPIVHAIAAFLTMRSFEFIRTDIGYPDLNVKLVGNFAGFLSEANGPTHQAVEDISLMRSVPNMNIFCPADLDDLLKGLSKIMEYSKPFYVRYNDLPSIIEHSDLALGQAEVFNYGDDAAILVYGTLFNEAFKAAELLKKTGIGIKLINLRTLNPIDEIELIKTIKSFDSVFTIEDHFESGGLKTIVSEIIAEKKLSVNLNSISLGKQFFKPLKLKELLIYEGFTAAQISNKIKENLLKKETIYNVEWSNG